eukprot:gb/GECH01009831.1/.p1 GENE.gb/GECH01009831.1/~~gb/GECH01009831.1/.p1  ORF type:complete len:163 (+),score=32.30 gb/GECH01009831.1/:1-489(+)
MGAEQSGTRRQPKLPFSSSSERIRRMTIYACDLDYHTILNHLGQSVNRNFCPLQSMLGTGSFQKAEHHFMVFETFRGTFIMTQIYFNGDLILEEYETEEQCIERGKRCVGEAPRSCWKHRSLEFGKSIHLSDIMSFYKTCAPRYELKHQNCQHYCSRWWNRF